MCYNVYILLCQDGTFYTGYAKNLKARLGMHERGKGARYTKIHKPKKLVYTEEFSTRKEAMHREKEIKKMGHEGKKKLCQSTIMRHQTSRHKSTR
jgi:putative endonuclease